MKILKQFAWMLEGAQQETVKQRVALVAKRYKLTKDGQLCITESTAEEDVLVLAKSAMSSSACASTDDVAWS